MASWIGAQCLALDTETTGISVHEDRIVTACAAIVRPGQVVYERQWLVAPDIEIPQAAIDVHGVDNERAQKEGAPPAEAIAEIANAIRFAVHSNMVVVAFNAAFDLSILSAECVRNGLGTLAEFCDRDIVPVVCPLTVDKAVDRYRKGKRTLAATTEFFGVTLDNAHDAGADAHAAAAVFHAMGVRAGLDAEALRALYADRRYPNELVRAWQSLARMSLGHLHAAQIQWYAEQSEALGEYWAKKAAEARRVAETEGDNAREATAALATATEIADEQERAAKTAEAIALRESAETAEAIALQEAAELDARLAGLSDQWPVQAVAT